MVVLFRLLFKPVSDGQTKSIDLQPMLSMDTIKQIKHNSVSCIVNGKVRTFAYDTDRDVLKIQKCIKYKKLVRFTIVDGS